MAHASKKHFGAGAQGKGSGEGALTPTPKDKIGENEVLANRDKAQNTGERGLDGKNVRSEQYQDHPGNRMRGSSERD